MAKYHHSLTVTLGENVREEDAQALSAAIRQLRGVIDVSSNVADGNSHIAETRARHKLADQLWNVLYPKDKA